MAGWADAMHVLDRPIWNALTSRQAHVAEARGQAIRFLPEVTSLAACTPGGFDDLAQLLQGDQRAGLLVDEEPALPASLARVDLVPVTQMVREGGPLPDVAHDFLTLGPADVPEMVELAHRTKPGPFARRSAELGTFLGVRVEGRLVAMAGQRMRVEGFTEVSGVCTDPSALGRGLAAALVTELTGRIERGGEVAFLHVRSENERAIALYRRLGFGERRRFGYLVVRRPPHA
jgi:ribosomal protein S18 acetylase RimI-like enzyme